MEANWCPFEQIRRYLICPLLSNATSSRTCHAEIARLTKTFDNLLFSQLLLKHVDNHNTSASRCPKANAKLKNPSQFVPHL